MKNLNTSLPEDTSSPQGDGLDLRGRVLLSGMAAMLECQLGVAMETKELQVC